MAQAVHGAVLGFATRDDHCPASAVDRRRVFRTAHEVDADRLVGAEMVVIFLVGRTARTAAVGGNASIARAALHRVLPGLTYRTYRAAEAL